MARGRWARRMPVLLAVTAVLTVGVAGAAYAGYRYDRAHATRVLPGVKIAGVDVGGMTRAEVRKAVRRVVAERLDRRIKVTVGKNVSTLTPSELGSRANVERAIDAAFAVSESYDWPTRVYHWLFDKPIKKRVKISISHSRDMVERFVDDVASRVRRPSVDASIDFVDGKLLRTHSRDGRALEREAAEDALVRALRRRESSVRFHVTAIAPDVTEEDLGKTIVVRISENRLYLYDELSLEKKYEVATGTPEYPTPQGHFEVINKRENPTWVNPSPDGWGASLPESIGPGPGNPLGTRALDINSPGIRIHGTYDALSIGSYASHGCIRMRISESEDIFERVDVGTPVIIAL